MHDRYDPQNDQFLDALIEGVIDSYEESREANWSKDEHGAHYPEGHAYRAFCDGVAKLMLGDTAELVGTSGVGDWPRLIELFGTKDFTRDVVHRLQVALAREHSSNNSAMAERCLWLVQNVLPHMPRRDVVRRYLRRLSRCFIAGFFPECVILCRASLENALDEAFERKGQAMTGKFHEKLNRARSEQWLSKQAWRDADSVRLRGNKAAHDDPEAVKDVQGTIRMTLRVLTDLTA